MSLHDVGSTLRLDQAISRVAWQGLADAQRAHEFDFDAVVLYVLRYDMIARWLGRSAARARKRFDELVATGLGDYTALATGLGYGTGMMDTQRQEISEATARVLAVQDDLVTIESLAGADGSPLIKNEVVLICPSPDAGQTQQERLKAEVLRVEGNPPPWYRYSRIPAALRWAIRSSRPA